MTDADPIVDAHRFSARHREQLVAGARGHRHLSLLWDRRCHRPVLRFPHYKGFFAKNERALVLAAVALMSLKWYYLLPFPLLPALCVYTARALRLAQGEKGEEIVLGLLVSLLLDLLYGGILLWFTRCDQ